MCKPSRGCLDDPWMWRFEMECAPHPTSWPSIPMHLLSDIFHILTLFFLTYIFYCTLSPEGNERKVKPCISLPSSNKIWISPVILRGLVAYFYMTLVPNCLRIKHGILWFHVSHHWNVSTLSRQIKRMRTEFHFWFAAIDVQCNSVILVLIKTNFLRFLLKMDSSYEWIKISESVYTQKIIVLAMFFFHFLTHFDDTW